MRHPLLSIPVLLLAATCASAESFETAPAGAFTALESSVGRWSAPAGQAQIHTARGKSGTQSLRLGAAGEAAAVLALSSAVPDGTAISLEVERWTVRGPFEFRIDTKSNNSAWKELENADETVKVGSFSPLKLTLPEGTREIRFRSKGPGDAGVLLDDVRILRAGPAVATSIETVQPVHPAFIRQKFNPVLGFRVNVEGTEGSVRMEGIELGFGGTTRMQDIASFQIIAGDAEHSDHPDGTTGVVVGEGTRISERISLSVKHELPAGEHWFWVSPILKNTASIDGHIDASVFKVKIGGKILEPKQASPEGSQRIGYAVRLPGDDKSKSYRIPGMDRTKAGTLIAVYDIRYRHAGDLPADIDVGVSRSTDGGQSWEPMRVAMNMGNDPKHGYDGVGDPSILVDPKTGRIWIAALWSHGNRGWNGSGPGLTPEETGQLMLAYSDDDGKSWSKPINITEQVKQPEWRLFFNGPGNGIVLQDGTLVFAAQYRAADGKPWSTLIASKDGGETWQTGSGVKSDTTEAQVAQLADGSIMINCRDNRGGSRTVATTTDLGQNWTLHPTDRSALREPVCMASLLRWQHPTRGDLIFFSNPDSTRGRFNMSVKLSRDQALTWSDADARLYDSRACFGYSCLAVASDTHIGVLYEGRGSMLYLRLPLDEWFK
jgi:sialidase-1